MTMTSDPDVIGWWAWMKSPAISDSTCLVRQHLIEVWTMANGKLDPDEVIEDILAENVTPYDTGLRLLDIVRDQAPGSISQYDRMPGPALVIVRTPLAPLSLYAGGFLHRAVHTTVHNTFVRLRI
jgi:hypothetical protein